MRRWVWGAGAAWLAVVVAGAGLAWLAIDRAGSQVTTSGPPAAISPAPSGSAAVPTTSPGPGAGSGSPTRSPTAPAARTPSRGPQFGTWDGNAGTVTVSCTGDRARLVGATPADGWRVEREDDADRVRVKFERAEREVEVRARCAGAGPAFEVKDSRDGGEG